MDPGESRKVFPVCLTGPARLPDERLTRGKFFRLDKDQMRTSENHFDKRRRSFLKLSGLLGLCSCSAALLPAQKAEALPFGRNQYKVSKTRLAMGTYVTMTLIHSSRDEAEKAIGLAFEEIDRLSAMLTHYDKNSSVGQLNSKGKLESSPEEVGRLITRSLHLNKLTGGAFDITVKPLIDLYSASFAGGRKPLDREIDVTLKLVGSEKLFYRGSELVFQDSQMAITFDGIAKGYIVDRASAVLLAGGIVNHLINAGGDIKASGSAEKGRAWTIAIEDPAGNRQYPDIVSMRDGAIATSGNYEIFYDREKLFHHIVNGRTGHSPQLSNSVSVLAPNAMDADALATSVFVMEPEAGLQFIESQPGIECFVIGSDNRISRSSGWQT